MNLSSTFCFTAALCLFVSCSGEKAGEKQEKIIPVKVIEIAATGESGVKTYVGAVEESVGVSLSFPTVGTVSQVYVKEGQRVSKGQLLATLNSATAENSYQGALAKLQQAQDAYDRLVKVHEKGSLPDIKFVEVETGLQQAKSMVAVMKKNVDDCRLHAPRSGIIASRNIEPGSMASPASAAFKLVSVDKVFVTIPVPENEIAGIQTGQTATVTVSALNNALYSGKIEMKGVAANALSHTYEAKIGIDNVTAEKNGSPLLPGMVCKVSIETGGASASEIAVPNRAIQVAADGKRYVWLAKDNVARRQMIKTGDFTADGIIVLEGLSAGDKVVSEGMQKISEGMKISITD